MNKFFFVLLVFLLAGLSACAVVPPPQPVNGIPLQSVAKVDDTGLFAADPAGEMVALANHGLRLLGDQSKPSLELSSDDPSALAWSLDGALLAAAFPAGENETSVLQFSRQGNPVHEVLLPVTLSSMTWSVRGDLLVAGYALKTYSFGANLRQVLFIINGTESVEVAISDTTLKPGTARKLAPNLGALQPVLFSRYGDELVYVRLHDPPEFPAYLNVLNLNWQGGAPRILLELPLQKVEILPGQVEDTVDLILAEDRLTVPLWPDADKVQDHDPVYRFVGGRLYDDEKLMVEWGKDVRLQILNDGRYFLASEGNLYKGSGLRVRPDEVYSEKKWSLRRWRASGLISPSEYRELLREDKQ